MVKMPLPQMAFKKFWKRKSKDSVAATAPVVNPCIGESLTEINERLRRIENKQKETSLQLESIDDFLQCGGTEPALVKAVIELSDKIEDFYRFVAADVDSPLLEQARMMWRAAKNAAEAAGFEIIDAFDEPFDSGRHSAESTEQVENMPNGYVAKTLKCGYIYKDEVIRRAAVVVNVVTKESADKYLTEEYL